MKRINLILLVILLIIGNVSIYFWKDSKINELNNQIIKLDNYRVDNEDLAQKIKNLESDVEFYQNLIGESGGELTFAYSPKISDTNEWRDYKKTIAVSGLKSFELKYPQIFYAQESKNGVDFYNLNFGSPENHWHVFGIEYMLNKNRHDLNDIYEKDIEASKSIVFEKTGEINIAGFNALKYIHEGTESGPTYVFLTEPKGGYIFHIRTSADYTEKNVAKLSEIVKRMIESLVVSK